MKSLLSALSGLLLLVVANGCCCDCCGRGCCNPCRPACESPCAVPTTALPQGDALSAYPNTYGPTVAAAPLEALPTY
jgi:hypothetical protein